jgi:hypothetical protein
VKEAFRLPEILVARLLSRLLESAVLTWARASVADRTKQRVKSKRLTATGRTLYRASECLIINPPPAVALDSFSS